MAHGDYNCCAICDVKMDYAGFGAEAKEDLCDDCLVRLQELKINVVTVDQLEEWINSIPLTELAEKLIYLRYSKCFYSNRIDIAVTKRISELKALAEAES